MKIFAIGDLHLSFGVPNKGMELFGEGWKDWTVKLENNWEEAISNDDLVLLPGDISWAMRPQEAVSDLKWIDRLPGTKVMIRGNHDFWWSSPSKVKAILPPSLHIIQNDAVTFGQVSVSGTRLWDCNEFNFSKFIQFQENPRQKNLTETDNDPQEREKIFNREIERLKLSLEKVDQKAPLKIAMTHYPPIGADLKDSVASHLFEQYGIHHVVFGHLHNVRENALPFGEKNGVQYHLVSADWLQFKPQLIATI